MMAKTEKQTIVTERREEFCSFLYFTIVYIVIRLSMMMNVCFQRSGI